MNISLRSILIPVFVCALPVAVRAAAGGTAEVEEVEEVEEAPGDAPAPTAPAPAPRAKFAVLWLEPVGRQTPAALVRTVSTLLEKALLSTDRIDLLPVDLFLRRDQGRPAEVDAGLARAAKFSAAGQDKLLNLALEEAVEDLQNARVEYRRHLAWLEDPEALIGTLMSLAEALAASGQPDAAEQAYREVLAFIPDYEPDPGQVPSKLRSLFEDVREATARELDCQLSVEAKPAGARVVLDGLTIGTAPLARSGFAPGLHVLRIEMEGYRPHRKTIDMAAGESTRVEETLARADRQERVQRISALIGAGAKTDELLAAGRSLGIEAKVGALLVGQLLAVEGKADPVLVLAVIPVPSGKPSVVAASLNEGQELQTVGALAFQIADALAEGAPPVAPPASLGLDFTRSLLGEARKLVAPLVVRLPGPGLGGPGGDEAYPGPPGPPPQDPPPPAATPIWGAWWFWTGVGAVVLGGVAAGLALSLGPETKTIYEPDQIRVRIER